MIDNKWFCEPNDQRECWCFLVIYLDLLKGGFEITGWEISYANPRKLIRIIKNNKTSEKEIIKELLYHIYYCRKNGILLITFGIDVLPTIRTRVILLDLKDASLREIKYLSIEKLMTEYFLLKIFNATALELPEVAKRMNIACDKISNVEMLQKIFLRIGPLLPGGVI